MEQLCKEINKVVNPKTNRCVQQKYLEQQKLKNDLIQAYLDRN